MKQIIENKRDALRSARTAEGKLDIDREVKLLEQELERYEIQSKITSNTKPICPWPNEIPCGFGDLSGGIDFPSRKLSEFEATAKECLLCYQVTALAEYYHQEKNNLRFARPNLRIDRFSRPIRLDFSLLRGGEADYISFTVEERLGMYFEETAFGNGILK
jgi:hypothetical protein